MIEDEKLGLTTSNDNLMEQTVGIIFISMVYLSFVERLNLNFSFSGLLSIVFLLSIVTFIFNSFKVKTNTTLISLFFITLIIGSLKAFKVFSLPAGAFQLFDKAFYGVFLSLTFLIILSNIGTKKLERAIGFNSFLALICSIPVLLRPFPLTFPEMFYDYIPVFFLILNIIIYIFRCKASLLKKTV